MRPSTRGRSVARPQPLPLPLPPVDDEDDIDDGLAEVEPDAQPLLVRLPEGEPEALVFRPRRGARREERRARRASERESTRPAPAAADSVGSQPESAGREMSAAWPLLWMGVLLLLLILWAILEPHIY